jgi:hypothetical protein
MRSWSSKRCRRSRATVETAIRELAELVQHFYGGAVSTAFLGKNNREITLR